MVLTIRPHFRRVFTSSTFGHPQCRSLLLLDHKTHQANHDVDIPELNSQLKQLIKLGNVNHARKVFDKMPKTDEVTWTNMISGYVGVSDSSEALALFSNMWVQPDIGMDPFLLSVALKACGLGGELTYGDVLHGYSVKSGFVNSVFVGSALVDMYMKVGEIEKGCGVFDEMPLRNVVSWTTVITGLVRAGYNVEGLDGRFLKLLTTASRLDIEDFLQKKVLLEVEVKVKENWRQDEGLLKNYGYGGS